MSSPSKDRLSPNLRPQSAELCFELDPRKPTFRGEVRYAVQLDRATRTIELHAADLTEAREKLFMFLTGWSGGPSLYIERYGHPMLRKRHMPFAIGESERDQWMFCMVRAMHEIKMEEPMVVRLAQALWSVADFMRNKPEGEAPQA